MIIAVFGDIHGNLEALRAVHRAAEERRADKIFHLGDLGGYAPFVNEVVDFLIEHVVAGVQGNYDDAVANDREHCGCKYEDPLQAEMQQRAFEWTKKRATPRTKEFLKDLPKEIHFREHGRLISLFHATPHKNNLYWYEDRPESFFAEMAAKSEADILIYAHTHLAYRKDLGGKVFINAGSVGRPKDGDPRACLTLVEVTPGEVRSEFLRVEYDVEGTAEAVAEQGLPSYFAEKLRQGR